MCNIFNLRKNVKDSEFGILYFSITYLLKCDTKINNLALSFLRWDEKKKVIIISKPLCVLAIQGVSIYFSTLMILLYITHNVQFVITAHIYQLSTHFELKVLGPLRYFLGLQVDYMSLWLLFINGNTFANSWLNFTCLIQTLAPSPISSSSTLCISATSPLSDPTQSCSLVGSLQYAAFTKPDIAFVVILP